MTTTIERPRAVSVSVKYQWADRIGVPKEVDPQSVGENLHALASRHDGELTPEIVVDAARPRRSPLHPLFTWDDKVAAEEWRKQEARSVINAVRIVVEDKKGEEQQHIAYVSVRTGERGERSYVSTSVLADRDDYYQSAIRQAMMYLDGFERRFAQIQEFAPVIEAIHQVRGRQR